MLLESEKAAQGSELERAIGMTKSKGRFPHSGFGGIQGGASGKESTCQCSRDVRDARDAGWIPGLRRSPGGGYDNPLQYSCLVNPTEDPGGLQTMGLQRVRQV